MRCRHCGSDRTVKSGLVAAKQRWICKDCMRTSRDGDRRERYSMEKRFRVVKLYLEGQRISEIERSEKVPNSLIIHWVRKAHDVIKDKILSVEISENLKGTDLVQLENIQSYVDDKYKNYDSALLIVGSEAQLVTWKDTAKKDS